MKKYIRVTMCILSASVLFTLTPSQAARMPKVEMCHWDADTMTFKKSSVSGNAVEPHLNHGDLYPGCAGGDLDDDCQDTCVAALARAYIDVDANGDYDSTIDVDIAVLLDSDMSGAPSAGDTVSFGQYPKSLAPCPDQVTCPDLGTFSVASHTVTNASSFAGEIIVEFQSPYCSIPCEVLFRNDPTYSEETFAVVNVLSGFPILHQIGDFHIAVSGVEGIVMNKVEAPDADPVGADLVASIVVTQPSGSGDNPFLNVIIY